jgi:hypothetical protein
VSKHATWKFSRDKLESSDRGGEVIGIERDKFFERRQEFRRDALRLGVTRAAVNQAVACGFQPGKILVFIEPREHCFQHGVRVFAFYLGIEQGRAIRIGNLQMRACSPGISHCYREQSFVARADFVEGGF